MSDIGFSLLKNAELQREDEAKCPSSVSKRQITASGAALMIPGSQVLTACSQHEIAFFFQSIFQVDLNSGEWEVNGKRFFVGDRTAHSLVLSNEGDKFVAIHMRQVIQLSLECTEKVCKLFDCVFPKDGGVLSANEVLARLAKLRSETVPEINIVKEADYLKRKDAGQSDNIKVQEPDASTASKGTSSSTGTKNNKKKYPKEKVITSKYDPGKNTKSNNKSSPKSPRVPFRGKDDQSQSANNNAKPDGNSVPDKSASDSTAKKSSSTAKTPAKVDPSKAKDGQSQSTDEQVAKSVPEKSKPASSTKKNSGSSKGGVLEKKSPGTGAMKPQEGTCSRFKNWFLGCCRKN